MPIGKRIHAKFYASDLGNEPVKEVLLKLGRPTKTIVGEDIRFVEMNWRVDRPYVDKLRSGRGEFEENLYLGWSRMKKWMYVQVVAEKN